MSTTRRVVLADVDAVQKAARALDRTDESCTTGKGVASRTLHRAAEPLLPRARTGVRDLPRHVQAYAVALGRLSASTSAVDGEGRVALENAVRDGQAEATALTRFAPELAAVWPRYEQLEEQETKWITRAVSGWYRSSTEAAAAYTVLVSESRPALRQARGRLVRATEALRAPTAQQSATLAAADEALAGLREGT